MKESLEDLGSLGALASSLPPPPSSDLLADVGSMRPVRTRVPLLALCIVAVAAAVYPVVGLAIYPLRPDLAALPTWWLVSVALVWLAGFIVPLTLAIMPRAGHVLPDGARAGRVAGLACLTAVLLGLLFTIDAPGVTIVPTSVWEMFRRYWWGCVSFGLKISIPAVLVAAAVLRKVAVTRLPSLGAAVGAAGGAFAGLALHALCPVGGAWHVGLAHGGGVVIGATIGALWLPLLVRLGGKRNDR
ncbi:MAG TPA: NrsF family protein [Polyangia bacterium]|nr:NrsF family protein [Polyangia bacterium]